METRKYHPCKLLDFSVMFRNPRTILEAREAAKIHGINLMETGAFKIYTLSHMIACSRHVEKKPFRKHTKPFHFHLFLLAPDKAGWEWGQEVVAETK